MILNSRLKLKHQTEQYGTSSKFRTAENATIDTTISKRRNLNTQLPPVRVFELEGRKIKAKNDNRKSTQEKYHNKSYKLSKFFHREFSETTSDFLLQRKYVLKSDLIEKVTERNLLKKGLDTKIKEIVLNLNNRNKEMQKDINNSDEGIMLCKPNDHSRNIFPKRFSCHLAAQNKLNTNNVIEINNSEFRNSFCAVRRNKYIPLLHSSDSAKKIKLKAKEKTEKLLRNIKNMTGKEYEQLNINKDTLSWVNLARVIELKKVQKGINDEEIFELPRRKITKRLEINQKEMEDYRKLVGDVYLLKRKFRLATIDKYKALSKVDTKGINLVKYIK